MSADILKEMADPRRRVMPLEERNRLKEKIANEYRDINGESPEFNREMKKHLLKHPPGASESQQSENKINLKRMELILKRQGQVSLTKAEVILVEKRIDVLKQQMRKMMVPEEDTQLTASKPGGAASQEFRRAVNKMAEGEMSPAFRKKAHELKNLLRVIGRDDPEAGNFENFRPKRGEV